MGDALHDYMFALWTQRPWGDGDALAYIEADLRLKLDRGGESHLFQRLISVYGRCVQRRGSSSSPEVLAPDLASHGSIVINGERVGAQELSRLALALMYGEYGLDSIVYGPRSDLAQRWREIERFTGWAQDDLIALSSCYQYQVSKFRVDQLGTKEKD